MHTRVILRNGKSAHLTGRTDVAPFAFIGRHDSGTLDLWQERGQWREDGTEHPLDIVSFLTPSGDLVALNGQSPV